MSPKEEIIPAPYTLILFLLVNQTQWSTNTNASIPQELADNE